MCVFWRLKVYIIALVGSLELYNYANIVVNGSIICKLLSLVALKNKYFILQKTLHGTIFFFFCQNNLRILRLKLTHVVVVKHVSDMKNRKI